MTKNISILWSIKRPLGYERVYLPQIHPLISKGTKTPEIQLFDWLHKCYYLFIKFQYHVLVWNSLKTYMGYIYADLAGQGLKLIYTVLGRQALMPDQWRLIIDVFPWFMSFVQWLTLWWRELPLTALKYFYINHGDEKVIFNLKSS